MEGISLDWRPEDLHIVEENERESQQLHLRLSPSQQMSDPVEDLQHDAQRLSFDSENSFHGFSDQEVSPEGSKEREEEEPPDKKSGQVPPKFPPRNPRHNQSSDEMEKSSWAEEVESEGTPGKWSPRPGTEARSVKSMVELNLGWFIRLLCLFLFNSGCGVLNFCI